MPDTADAAVVKSRRGAATTIEEFKPHQGTETMGKCPYCGDQEKLYTTERVIVEREADVVFITGISAPEIEYLAEQDEAAWTETAPVIIGVGCRTCKWAYEGENPLARLAHS